MSNAVGTWAKWFEPYEPDLVTAGCVGFGPSVFPEGLCGAASTLPGGQVSKGELLDICDPMSVLMY